MESITTIEIATQSEYAYDVDVPSDSTWFRVKEELCLYLKEQSIEEDITQMVLLYNGVILDDCKQIAFPDYRDNEPVLLLCKSTSPLIA